MLRSSPCLRPAWRPSRIPTAQTYGRVRRHIHSPRGIDSFTAEQISAAAADAVFPIVISADGTHALRKRHHGNRALPLPPHMDPIRRAQRNRWKKPKAEAPRWKDMSDFQKKLAANPFAQALATPVRQCSVTRIRLPSFFLLPFQLTDSATSLPADDAPSPSVPASDAHTKSARLFTWVPAALFAEANDGKVPPTAQSQSYTLLTQHMLRLLHQHSDWDLLRSHGDAVLDRAGKRVKYATIDCGDAVLDALRRIVMRRFRDVVSLQEKLERPCMLPYESGTEVEGEVACVLDLASGDGDDEGRVADVRARLRKSDEYVDKRRTQLMALGPQNKKPYGSSEPVEVPQLRPELRYPPLRFPLMDLGGGQKVSVYRLADLLGEKSRHALARELGTTCAAEEAAVMLSDRHTLRLRLALHRLQCYRLSA